MSTWLLVLVVLTFAHAADVCADGECHDAEGGLSMLQGSRERTSATSSDNQLAGDLQRKKRPGDYETAKRVCVDPDSQWSHHPNTYCVGNWGSDWAGRAIKTPDACKSDCQASATCLGVVVGTYQGTENRCVQCTSLAMRPGGWPSTYLKAHPSWCQITCPVMGALFKAGDLVPDETGHVSKAQVVEAMLRVGISHDLVLETTNGNFDHLPAPHTINLFNMDLQRESEKEQGLRNVEHDFSTGIRDGGVNNAEEYLELEQFIGEDGDSENWSLADLEKAIDHYKNGATNDEGAGEGGINSLKNMFNEFKNANDLLSKYEFKQLFMDSDYPVAFTERRAAAVSAATVSGSFSYDAQ